MMITDLTFVPLLEKIADKLPTIERYIVLTDAAHMPQTTLKNAVAYEDWIAEVDGDFHWASFDENTASGMCYTSGTTGHPKGVLYSHRSNVLHAYIAALPDSKGIASRDVVMPVVPMFHANCWSLAFSTPMVGATLVMPGAKMDGASIYELLNTYKVTFTAAVPTVWLMLLQDLEKTGGKLPHLKRVVIGGSACPRAMTKTFQDVYGVEVVHAWGMTEMSPLGSLCTMKPEYAALTGEAQLDVKMKQGHPPFGVEMKITDDNGKELPWDGKTFGRLKVRGPAVAKAYYKRRQRPGVSRATAGSTPATSPPWTNTATCRSPTAPRTSSSRAANGFPRSIWKTSRSAIPRWRKPPRSASRIRNGTSGRCW